MANKPYYTDIDLRFIAHPISGDIIIKKDKFAVEQSVTNLVLSSLRSFLNEPEIGSNLYRSLFRQNTPLLAFNINESITETIKNHETRIEIKEVQVTKEKSDVISMHLTYYFLNQPEPQSVSISLERFR